MIVDKVVLENGMVKVFAGRETPDSEPRVYAELILGGEDMFGAPTGGAEEKPSDDTIRVRRFTICPSLVFDYLEEFIPLQEAMVSIRKEYAQMVAERKFSPAALLRYVKAKKNLKVV
jgi:hypothetical protein